MSTCKVCNHYRVHKANYGLYVLCKACQAKCKDYMAETDCSTETAIIALSTAFMKRLIRRTQRGLSLTPCGNPYCDSFDDHMTDKSVFQRYAIVMCNQYRIMLCEEA